MNPKSTHLLSQSALTRVIALLGISAALLASNLHADVLYEQAFTNTSGSTQTLGASSSGWKVYQNVTATDQTNNNTLWFVHNINGYDNAPGYLVRKAVNGANISSVGLAFTTTSIAVDSVSSLSVVFRTASSNTLTAGDTMRFAVQISGQWYASTTISSPQQATWAVAGASPTTLNFDTSASAWNKLTFTAGSSLSATALAADAPLSGTITAVGLFFPSQSSVDMFADQFQVNGSSIPEPSTAAMLSGMAVLGFCVCSRPVWRRRMASSAQ